MLVNKPKTVHSLAQMLPTALLHPRRVRKLSEKLDTDYRMHQVRMAKERKRREQEEAERSYRKELEKIRKVDPERYLQLVQREQIYQLHNIRPGTSIYI